jgi:hypothetical protein
MLLESSITKYDLVTALTKTELEMTFSSRDAANEALNNPFLSNMY